MWRYILAWLPMVPIAVANGVVRELWYGRHLGELQAHQVSTLSALVLLGLYMGWVIRQWRPRSGSQAVAIGAVWLMLTVAFELLFGHYGAGHPWSRLLQDYDLSAGRLWPLVLLWVAVAPYLFHRWR
jgi:hypothetical protein